VFASTANDFIARSIADDRAFLETFNPERDRNAFEAAWQARAQGAVGEVKAFEPHYEGSPVVWPGAGHGRACSAKGSHRFEARAGHHLAPAQLASGDNVYQHLGPGFTLLTLEADATSVLAFRDAAAALRLPLTLVTAPAQGEATRYAARWVLVRPDHFVAWAHAEPVVPADTAREVLALAVGRAT
jgi:hypothetical protein